MNSQPHVMLHLMFNRSIYNGHLLFRNLLTLMLHRWIRLVREKDVISGREALKKRLEAKVLCAVPDYIPFSMRTELEGEKEKG